MKQTMKGWLSSAPAKLSQLYQPDLYRIDIEQVAKELDLQNEAKKLAAAGLPLPNQTAITAPEAKTVQRIEKARHDFVEWASYRLNVLNEGLARRDITVLANDALFADREFERRAGSLLDEHETLVHELADNTAMRERELHDFKANNQLTRPATYPEGGAATFARYAVLMALIVVEGIANAYFFSLGLDSGLIGGFLAAGLFAAVNLVTAFVLGKYAVPFVWHRNPALKGMGLVGAAFAVLCMIGVGLMIAHFRDALIADAAEPARAAWIALQASPFGLRDVMSWLLFAISVLFAVFALFDGLSSDDRYPGYGEVARRARQSRDDYLGELQSIRRQLEEIKDDELNTLDRAVQKARTLVAESTGLLRDKNWARTKMETALLDAENCLDTLLKIFRDTNQMQRGTLARPHYFDTRPALQRLAIPEFGTDQDRARLDEQERLVQRLLADADKVRANIEASFNARCDHLKPARASQNTPARDRS